MQDYTFTVNTTMKLQKEVTISAENEDDAFFQLSESLDDQGWEPAETLDLTNFDVMDYTPKDEDDEEDGEEETETENL